MSLDKVIPFTSKSGNKYLIQFGIFKGYQDLGIPVVDVSLVLAEHNSANNSIKDLKDISQIIIDYLNKHDVIIYYYCDNKEIKRRDRKILPQEYRFRLFDRLFCWLNHKSLIKNDIIINDDSNNDIHFISLISNKRNIERIKDISEEINRMSHK